MNNDLQKALTDIITDTKSFVFSELPDIAREVILMGYFHASIKILLTLAYLLLMFIHREEIKRRKAEIEVVFVTIGGVFCAAILASGIMQIAKIALTPKLYLIEYASRLIQ